MGCHEDRDRRHGRDGFGVRRRARQGRPARSARSTPGRTTSAGGRRGLRRVDRGHEGIRCAVTAMRRSSPDDVVVAFQNGLGAGERVARHVPGRCCRGRASWGPCATRARSGSALHDLAQPPPPDQALLVPASEAGAGSGLGRVADPLAVGRTRGSTRRPGSGRGRRPTRRRCPRRRRRPSSPGAAPGVGVGSSRPRCLPAVRGSEAVEEQEPRHRRNEPEHSRAVFGTGVVDQPVTFPAELRHRLAVEVVRAARWRVHSASVTTRDTTGITSSSSRSEVREQDVGQRRRAQRSSGSRSSRSA